jgi:hypothetical protein
MSVFPHCGRVAGAQRSEGLCTARYPASFFPLFSPSGLPFLGVFVVDVTDLQGDLLVVVAW